MGEWQASALLWLEPYLQRRLRQHGLVMDLLDYFVSHQVLDLHGIDYQTLADKQLSNPDRVKKMVGVLAALCRDSGRLLPPRPRSSEVDVFDKFCSAMRHVGHKDLVDLLQAKAAVDKESGGYDFGRARQPAVSPPLPPEEAPSHAVTWSYPGYSVLRVPVDETTTCRSVHPGGVSATLLPVEETPVLAHSGRGCITAVPSSDQAIPVPTPVYARMCNHAVTAIASPESPLCGEYIYSPQSPGTAVPVEETMEQGITTESHGNTHAIPPSQLLSPERAVQHSRPATCVERYHTLLLSLCHAECERTDALHTLGGCTFEYVCMQAVRPRDTDCQRAQHRGYLQSLALARAHQAQQQKQEHESDILFSLDDPSVLLTGSVEQQQQQPVSGQAAISSATTTAARDLPAGVPCKTIVVGESGKGKTMLCQRVLFDFLHGARTRLRDRFDYIIPISIRESNSLSTSDPDAFLGLNHPALAFNEQERQAVKQHLAENSSRILLIFDGIDESKSSAFSPDSAAHAFLQRRQSVLMDASALITSRPGQQACRISKSCNRHYRLAGFTDAQLTRFVDRHLGAEAGKVCISSLDLASRQHLKQAVQSTPLLAAILCQQFSLSQSVPSTTTLFFVHYLCSAIARLEQRRPEEFGTVTLSCTAASQFNGGQVFQCGEEVGLYTVVEHHLEQFVMTDTSSRSDAVHVVSALQELYRVSLDGLLLGQHSFDCSKFTRTSAWWCLELGVLVSERDHHRSLYGYEKRVALPHPTIQEWCASRACTSAADLSSSTAHCLISFGVAEERWGFWKFVFGSARTDDLHALLAGMKTQGSEHFGGLMVKKFRLFLMGCLLEHCLCSHGEIPHGERTYSSAASLIGAEAINFSGTVLDDGDIMAVSNILQLLPAGCACSLDLSNCMLSAQQLVSVAPWLHKASSVQLSGNDLSGPPLRAIGHCLKQSSGGLQSLCLTCTSLVRPGEDGMALADCLSHSTLTFLSLKSSQLGNVGLARLAECMPDCPNLELLSFGDCSLSEGCGSSLAHIVRRVSGLQQLFLYRNRLRNNDASLVLTALCSSHSLIKCNIDDNLLDNDILGSMRDFLRARHELSPLLLSAARIAKSAGGRRPLSHCIISISGNRADRHLLDQLAASGVARSGDEVYLGGLSLAADSVQPKSMKALLSEHGGSLEGFVSDELVADLGNCLAADATLREIFLRHSQLNDIGIQAWAMCGPSCYQNVQVVDVGSNNIGLSGAAVLVDAFRNSPALRCLRLDGNPIFAGGTTTVQGEPSAEYELLFAALSELNNLRCLTLDKTDMQVSVAERLMLTVKQMSPLVFLGVSCNDLGDRIAELLVEHLECGGSLAIVDLQNNGITATGVQLLASCTAITENMEHVWLCGNSLSGQRLCRPLSTTDHVYDFDFLTHMVDECSQ
ncbi:uncharacterized protein LOC135805956 [Sycon ciliatum]|uniref:uncharacterized protein LOC135805956 n=1 Tax=Sycon ciliatum TaxID=27933 RepID=UPI0031F6CBE9